MNNYCRFSTADTKMKCSTNLDKMEKLQHILNPLYSEIYEVSATHEKIFMHRARNSNGQPSRLLELVYRALANSPVVQKTMEMRDLQKLYYENRDTETLKAAKQLEFEVDLELKKIKRLLRK